MTALLITAFLLRLILLSDSFWLDEAAQVLESTRPLAEQLQIAGDFQPPLMHLLTFFWLRFLALFGWDRLEALIRFLPSFIPGIISVWATYQIALNFWPKTKVDQETVKQSKTIASISALFLATSPLHIFFSQELRPYSLAMMWACLSLLALLKWGTGRRSRLSFIIFSILGLYSSYLYPFWLFFQLAYLLLVQKVPLKNILTPLTIIILAFLPWWPKFFEQLTVGQSLRAQMPGWAEVVSLPQIKSLPLVPLKFIYGLLDLELNFFFLASFSLIFFLALALYFQQRSLPSTKQALRFFNCFFLAPLLFIWLFSFMIPVLQPKRVLFLLPAFFIFLSVIINQAKNTSRYLAKALFVLIFAIHLLALTSYWSSASLQREDWRALVTEMEYNFGASRSVVVFSFTGPFAPYSYYSQGVLDTFSTDSFYLPNEADLANRLKVLADYDYVLLFDYLRDLTDPENQLPVLIGNLAFEEIGVFDYPNIGFVRIYTKGALRAYENRPRCQ